MLTEAGTPGTDDWYLLTLATEMGANYPRLGKLRKYREGDAPVPDGADPSMRAAYKQFVSMARLNMCELIVNSKTARMKVVGFRTAAADDAYGDSEAYATWKRSHMPVLSRSLFGDLAHYGQSFITVFGTQIPGSDGTVDEPYMTGSDGWTTWTKQDPNKPWESEAAIHVGYDSFNGVDTIILYRPGYFRIAQKLTPKSTIPTDGSLWKPNADWTWTGGPISLGYTQKVPVVRLQTLDGRGVYEGHLDSIDRINDGIKQRCTIIAMQAFRQRALKGDLPTEYPEGHDRAGDPIDYNDIFKAGPAALWLLPSSAEVWESTPTDIGPVLNSTKDDTKNLAAVTATPLYVLSPDSAGGSAEGASLARETHVFSVEELIDVVSDGLAQALGITFEAARDSVRADPALIDVIWASVDRASMAEWASASSQAKAGGMPQKFIDEKIFGFTPAEIAEAAQLREDESFSAGTQPETDDPAPGAVIDPATLPPTDTDTTVPEPVAA
jgi:hypothetical protein